MSGPALGDVHDQVVAWFEVHRRDLPWRRTRDPWSILVAEIMLQQTQVSRVESIYRSFLHRFPDARSLAAASVADVIRAWSGMGYNRRAVNLHRAATRIVVDHGGDVPRDPAALRDLPGIGPYTAAAVACFAFEASTAVVDTNVRRILGRVFVGLTPISLPAAWRLAEQCLPQGGRAWVWNQALMDLGATTCRSADPQCGRCPLVDRCLAAPAFALGYPGRSVGMVAEGRPEERFIGSSRYRRGLVVEELRNAPAPLPLEEIRARLTAPPPLGTGSDPEPWLAGVIAALERDGLARSTPEGVSLP